MNKTIGSVSALIALSAATASAEIRAAPFSNIGLDITNSYSEYVDLDGDEGDDFLVWENGSVDMLTGLSDREVVVEDLVDHQAKRFVFGANIGALETSETVGFWSNWLGQGRSYAGVKFISEGATNWGWIELHSPNASTGIIVRAAWESIDEKSIRAGAWPARVAPTNGFTTGGETVLIDNSDFGNITNVTVGGGAAAIQGSGTNWVRITTPAGSAGVKDIVIQTDNGDLLLVDAFTYIAAGGGGGGEAVPTTSSGADFKVKKTLITPTKPSCGGKFIVWVEVENKGTVKGDAGYLSLVVDGKYFGAVKVGSLDKRKSKVVKFTNVKTTKKYSPIVLTFKVDCYNVTKETNETNNTTTKNVICR